MKLKKAASESGFLIYLIVYGFVFKSIGLCNVFSCRTGSRNVFSPLQ